MLDVRILHALRDFNSPADSMQLCWSDINSKAAVPVR